MQVQVRCGRRWQLHLNSLRFSGNPSNLIEDTNLELVVQREQDRPSSSKIDKSKKLDELLIQGGHGSNADQKLFHKFKHKIIVSDAVIKNRWSDVNSSDLLFLNSEMLSVMSSNRFSGIPMDDSLVKINEANSSNAMTALDKRSKSEITHFSRFRDFTVRHKIKEAAVLGSNGGEEERRRRLWLPIVQRTVQWLVGRERKSQELETGRQSLNV